MRRVNIRRNKRKTDSVLVLQIDENYDRRAVMLISVTMVHDGSRMDMFNVVDERSCSCSCGRGGAWVNTRVVLD